MDIIRTFQRERLDRTVLIRDSEAGLVRLPFLVRRKQLFGAAAPVRRLALEVPAEKHGAASQRAEERLLEERRPRVAVVVRLGSPVTPDDASVWPFLKPL